MRSSRSDPSDEYVVSTRRRHRDVVALDVAEELPEGTLTAFHLGLDEAVARVGLQLDLAERSRSRESPRERRFEERLERQGAREGGQLSAQARRGRGEVDASIRRLGEARVQDLGGAAAAEVPERLSPRTEQELERVGGRPALSLLQSGPELPRGERAIGRRGFLGEGSEHGEREEEGHHRGTRAGVRRALRRGCTDRRRIRIHTRAQPRTAPLCPRGGSA